MATKHSNTTDEEIAVTSIEEPKPALVRSKTKSTDVLSLTLTVVGESCYDIEHILVRDDPRAWSNARKTSTLILISFASMIATLASTIQNPAVEQIEADLRATGTLFSLDISTFILIQGLVPLIWSTIYEVKGSKFVYIISLALFTLANIMLALSRQIGAVIGFRSLQAAGSSAVMAIGPASLADIFDAGERGQKMGIYNVALLLGPALGPILGGFLASIWNWRAIFWFLTIVSGTTLSAFIFLFRDTFRRERSFTYQRALRQRRRNMPPTPTSTETLIGDRSNHMSDINIDAEKILTNQSNLHTESRSYSPQIKIAIIDLNLFKSLSLIVQRNNFLVLLSSGLFFAYGFLVYYTSARTLAGLHDYDPFKTGLVITLAYGIACIFGGTFGGWWSDRELRRLKTNNGQSYPEIRLKSAMICACLMPFSVAGFGWLSQERRYVSVIAAKLVVGGFLNNWIHSIIMVYIVDANSGRASAAAAAASAFRGMLAFAAVETAVPLQDRLGNGPLFTIWSGLVALAAACALIVWLKGAQWREQAESQEREDERGWETPSTARTAFSSN